jgi:gliding motility-associated-like protein
MKVKIIIGIIIWLVCNQTGPVIYAQPSVTLCAGVKGVKYQVSGDSSSTFHWFVQGGTIVSDSNANTISVNWPYTPGNYTLSVFEERKTGCLGNNNTLLVTLLPVPVINLGNTKSMCEGGQITFQADTARGVNDNTYLWQDGSTGSSYTAKSAGMYWVEITNPQKCSFRDSVMVLVNPLPKVNLGKDTMLCNNDDIVLDAENFGATYFWNTGVITQTITAHANEGLIWVRITDAFGCIGTDSIQLLTCSGHPNLIIPKAFTPNRGTTHNLWIIGGIENYPKMTVKIYDRWGILIYESDTGYSNPWDGTSGGRPMPMDAYYYLIHPGDGSRDIVGSVTLIR